MDSSFPLLHRCRKFVNMLKEMDVIMKSLQSRGHTSEKCRGDLDLLMETVQQKKATLIPFFQCKLESTYISSEYYLFKYPAFEQEVI